jgi:hypothetical protein
MRKQRILTWAVLADDELYGALLSLEAHAGALKEQDGRRTAALARVTLWEYVREQADIHQAAAVEAARTARVEWTDLAPALAVKPASAAYNKSARLRAAVLSDLSPDGAPTVPVCRTPEAVLAAERHAASVQRRNGARRNTPLVATASSLQSRSAYSTIATAWTTTKTLTTGWSRSRL